MNQITGKYGSGSCPRQGKDYSHGDQHGHQAPCPAKLGSVHQAEQHAGDYNSRSNAQILREKRVEIATKNRLFHQRSNQYSHAHQKKSTDTTFKKFLDWKIFWRLYATADNRHAQGQCNAASEINPGTGRHSCDGNKLSPTERPPEGKILQNWNADVKEQDKQRI